MTKQQILEQIAALETVREVGNRLRDNRGLQDHLRAVADGQERAATIWMNTSSLAFPEDFEEDMNQLSKDQRPIDKMLEFLRWMEGALEDRKKELLGGRPSAATDSDG
jgi:hypothetical protein